LEGELSWAQLEKLKSDLSRAIKPEEDSILLYVLRDERWMERQRLGKSKGEPKWVV
jgi:CRISPR-associated protein Cas2